MVEQVLPIDAQEHTCECFQKIPPCTLYYVLCIVYCAYWVSSMKALNVPPYLKIRSVCAGHAGCHGKGRPTESGPFQVRDDKQFGTAQNCPKPLKTSNLRDGTERSSRDRSLVRQSKVRS